MSSAEKENLPVLHTRDEPPAQNLDPRVILDTNIPGQAWLWHTDNEGEAYLVYDGETKPLRR